MITSSFELSEWVLCFDSAEQWIIRLENRPPISVVIPIFNGFEPVSRLLKDLDLWSNCESIVLVNDCSTDPRIEELLLVAQRTLPNVIVVTNRRNLGFVKSVNLGIQEIPANNDVVILNSDAHPLPSWLHQLATCAYSFDSVATVCPVSNSAGFFSFLTPNQGQPLPDGWSPALVGNLIRLCAPQFNETAPVTSGFCWYLTAAAIDRVGLLDELLVRRGYGEESDYCLRAVKNGFKNLVSLSCFVEHVGGLSFGGDRATLKRINSTIVKALHPEFKKNLVQYESNSCLHDLSQRINKLMTCWSLDKHIKLLSAPLDEICFVGWTSEKFLFEISYSGPPLRGTLYYPINCLEANGLVDLIVYALFAYAPLGVKLPASCDSVDLVVRAAKLIGAQIK